MTTLRPPLSLQEADPGAHFPGILALYRAHNWTHAGDPERLRTAVDASYSVVALDGDAVVGYARAMTDQAFAVYIADILVRPDRQREGIGRALVDALLERFPVRRYHHQVLVAERGAEGFYRKLGLVPVSAFGLTAFIRSRR